MLLHDFNPTVILLSQGLVERKGKYSQLFDLMHRKDQDIQSTVLSGEQVFRVTGEK